MTQHFATIELTVTRDKAPNVTMRDVFKTREYWDDDCPDIVTVIDHLDALVESVKRALGETTP